MGIFLACPPPQECRSSGWAWSLSSPQPPRPGGGLGGQSPPIAATSHQLLSTYFSDVPGTFPALFSAAVRCPSCLVPRSFLLLISSPTQVSQCRAVPGPLGAAAQERNSTGQASASARQGDPAFSLSISRSFNLSILQSRSLSIFQSFNPSVFRSFNPSIFQSVSLSIFQSFDPSIFFQSFDPSISQSFHLSVFQSFDPSILQSLSLSIFQTFDPSIFQSFNPSVSQSFGPSTLQSVDPSVFRSSNLSTLQSFDLLIF